MLLIWALIGLGPCGSIDVPETPEALVVTHALVQAGWHGHADDHREALYNPMCH